MKAKYWKSDLNRILKLASLKSTQYLSFDLPDDRERFSTFSTVSHDTLTPGALPSQLVFHNIHPPEKKRSEKNTRFRNTVIPFRLTYLTK